jgi:predicted DsbA family dithiol-disulfide isomerase
MNIDVEVISDAICPWCFVGKRRLEKAIQTVKGYHRFDVHWKPFQLNPTMPPGGMSRKEYREKKFGSPKVVEEMDLRMKAVGTEEGIPFALDRIEKTPNTFDAHRLIWQAGQEGVQDAVVEGLFRAFFTQGRDIGDRSALVDIGVKAGLDRASLEAFLTSDEGVKDVRAEEAKAREIGVDAVPYFIIGGKIAVPGAQSPDVFLEAFRSL